MRARPRTLLLSTATAGGLLAAGVLVGVSLADQDAAPVADPVGEPTAEPGRPAGSTRPVAWQGDGLVPADSCEELLAWHVDRAEELVTPWGWAGYAGWPVAATDLGAEALASVGGAMRSAASDSAATSADAGGMTNATQSGTGTNVQEAGVDEPDVAKSDGRLLVRVEPGGWGGGLVVADVTGATVRETARLDLPDVVDPELLLVGDAVVVVGADREAERGAEGTRLLRVDVSDPGAPVVTDTLTLDSALLSVRQHGSVLRFVVESGLPDLPFGAPGRGGPRGRAEEDAALKRNLEAVRATTVDDWLPHVTTYAADGTSRTSRLLACEDVALPADPGSADGSTPGTVAIVGLDAAEPLDGLGATDGSDDSGSDDAGPEDAGGAQRVGVAVGTDLVYASTERLYLATSGAASGCCWMFDGVTSWRGGPLTGSRVALPEPDGTSELHEFVLDGTGATYTASGEVDGAIRDRWSMDEHDGKLRVAVGPTVETGNWSSIVVLADTGDGRLDEVGRVDRIGPREDIEAVRWFGDLALVVTFRQVDPLYTVDLADPARPQVVGELKIPGFSAYLHPLGPHRLLGIGEGPVPTRRGGESWGAQAGLFDLADLAEPRRLDVESWAPGTRHVAATDPRAFTWLPGSRTALSVLTRGWGARTGWVSVVRLRDGVISQELVEVEHGSDVERVRLVRLPDTRVLLVTGDDASFFPV
ncbi:MAG: beta-propeller domain-containing protein [Nocardioides sp.]